MEGTPLLREWTMLESRLVPALLEVHESRPPVTWSMGPAGDAVALVLVYEHASRDATDLRAFATEAVPHSGPVSFGRADLRRVPPGRRDKSLSRHEHRWTPNRSVIDRVVLSDPTGPVDLVTIRADGRSPADAASEFRDRLRPGGHLLVLDPSPRKIDPLPGFVAISEVDSRHRLYRRRRCARAANAWIGSPDAPPDQPTLATRSAQDELVVSHLRLARSLARRFAHHGERPDDLEQVALLALVKASRRFDPSLNFTFATFATTSIQGELKRHFRDKTWAMRVPRAVQELYLGIKSARDELSQQLGATPTIKQIASHLGSSEEAVLDAMEAGDAYWPDSLNAGFTDEDAGTDVPIEEPGYERAIELHEMQEALPRLDRREQFVVGRVYIERCTQRTVADQLGISQMQVSRILNGALAKLRRGACQQ